MSILAPFASMTKDPQEQKNLMLLGLSSVFATMGTTLYGGQLLTAFNAQYGITPAISAYAGIPGRILMIVAMLCAAPLIDRVKNRLFFNGFTLFLVSLSSGAMLLKCLGPDSFRTVTAIVVIDIVWGIPFTLVSAVRGGADAIVQCRAIHNEIRGRFWGIFGMITGLIGLPMGIFVTWLLKSYSVRAANVIAIIPGIFFSALAGLCAWRCKELPDLQNETVAKKEPILESIKKTITMKQFRIMMPANLMRSMGDGCVAYALLLALQRWGLPQEYAGYSQTLSAIAPFLGYVVLGLTLDRFGAKLVLPVTDFFMGLGMVFMVAIPNGPIFLAATALYQVLLITECAAIPLAHYEVVPNEVIGAFSNVRLLLMNLAGFVSGTVAGICLDHFSPLLVFSVCAVIKVSAGLLFSYGIIKLGKHDVQEETPSAT